MWDMKEKSMMYRHQSMRLNSAGPRSSFVENLKPSSTVNSLNWHCLGEASRKRKAVDLDLGGDVSNYSASYCRNLRGNLGDLLHGETNPQHNVSALQAIGSREKYPEVSHSSLSIKSSDSQSPYEYYQSQNVNNMSMSFQKEDDKFQRAATDSPNPWAAHHKEQSLNKTVKKSIGGILNLPGSQHLAFDTASQAEVSKLRYHSNQIGGFTKETLPVLGPKIGINRPLGNNNLPSNPSHYSQNMNSHNFTFLGSPSLKMGSNRLYPVGGNSVQGIDKNGLIEVKKKAEDMGYGEDKSISISTTNSMQISAGNGIEKSHESYQNSNSETRYVNNPRSDAGDAHFDVRVEEHNCPVLLQLPVIAQSSASAQVIVDYRLLNKSAHIFKDFENRTPEKENEPIIEANNQFVDDGSPLKCDVGLDKRPSELGDGLTSFNMNEQNKSAGGKVSQVVAQKLWDGSLQLNTSIKVSAIAFFKSGEKAPDINWSQHIEIKGKVRLQAFEKFIQELPRSRSRAMMVISLCWKIGSSKDGLKGMKEVSKGYRDSERVGFAQIAPGIDLYVCPHSDTIFMILAKYGFFKGMAAVEEDRDSLIGCVIWRRGLLSSKSDTMKLEKKEDPLQGQPVNSPESSTMENNSPQTMNNAPEIKQAAIQTRDAEGEPSAVKSETKPTAPESKIIKSNKESDKTSSIRTTIRIITPSIPCNSPITPVRINSAEEPDSNSVQDLREQAEISNNHLVEPDLDSKPRLPVLQGPHQISPGVQHSNTQPRKDSHNSSSFYTYPVPELTSIDFPHLPSRLPAFQKPNLNIKQNPVQSVVKAEFATMNIAERRKLDTTIEMATSALPGPPLPPEVWQRNILSNGDKDSLEGLSKAYTPAVHVAEWKKATMHHEPTGPTFPGPPRMIPQSTQRSANPDEDDDLPEFDFSSACGVSQTPVSKFPWSNDGTQLGDAPPWSEKLPVEVIKSANEDKPPVMPILKPIEAMLKPQVSSLPDIAFSAPRAGESVSENKEAAKATQSRSKSHIERASKIQSSLISGCSSPRKNRWDDDDDDMPEWCPPDLENLQQSKPSTTRLPFLVPKADLENLQQSKPSTTWLPFLVPRPFSEISAPRPSIPVQAPPSFCPSQNQGFFKHDQAGILGPCPAGGNSAMLPQTRPAAGLVPTGLRPPMTHNLSNSLGAQASKFNIGRPSRVGQRLQRR